MISQFPKWVGFGAFLLALVAGCVNAVGLLSFEHQSVSHLSGTATLLGTSLIHLSLQQISHLLGVLVSFTFGAMLAGFLLHGETLKLGKHYDTALFLESALLLFATWFLLQGSFYGHFLASAACGLQNAFATKYSGAIIRTTHVTGIFTDLGIMFGAFMRGEAIDRLKVKLLSLIIFGFIAGGSIGAIVYAKYHVHALILPAAICLLIGSIYRIYLKCEN